jgi:hypothetical protein
MTFIYWTFAALLMTLGASNAFQISRRVFLVDTTMSCGVLVKRSSPLAVDNIKEEAIRDFWMSPRQIEQIFHSEPARDVASNNK